MPKMNGTEVAKVIRSKWPDIPILLASGCADLSARDGISLPKLPKPYFQ
jgi:CheY-like chemotaxis protein